MKYLIRLSLPIFLMVLLVTTSIPAYAQLGVTTRLMVGGNPIDASSPSISNDGRYIVFESPSDTLVANDTNFVTDIFRYDTQTGIYTRISVNSAGLQGNGHSYQPAISGNGRYVVFVSQSSNWFAGVSLGIYMRDTQTNTTTLISRDSNGNPIDDFFLILYDISADGRYVVFTSDAADVVPNDTNNVTDTFLYDRQTNSVSRVSVNGNGDQLDMGASNGQISDNGRYLAFSSGSTNVIANDTNGNEPDAFVKDLQTGQVTVVSVDSSGNQATYLPAMPLPGPFPFLIVDDISADGRYVTFASNATNLVANDTNDYVWDQFFHDRQTGQTKRISINNNGTQADDISGGGVISDDGRYVFFESMATNLVSNDTNNAIDVFMFDTQTNSLSRISLNEIGQQMVGDSGSVTLSADMRYVVMAYRIESNNPSSPSEIIIYDRLVLSAPTLISPANGFTTTNPNITFSWNSVVGAIEYQVQVAYTADFSDIIEDYTVNTTTFDSSYLSGTYYWRVRAKNGFAYGEWSEVRYVIVQIPINPPNLISPANESFSSSNVTFTWSSVTYALGYDLQVAKDTAFTDLVVDKSYIYNTSYSKTINLAGIYYWRVRAFDYSYNYGPWSQSRMLLINTLLAPILTAPADSFTTTSPNITFSWNTVSGSPTGYEIQISAYSNFATTLYTKVVATTTDYYTFTVGGTYYWRVRAKKNSIAGMWSAVRSLTIPPISRPVLLSPETNTNLSNPVVTLTWEPINGVTQYQILVTRTPWITGEVVADQIVNTTSYTMTLPQYSFFLIPYYWRVRALGYVTGEWSYTNILNYEPIPFSSGSMAQTNMVEERVLYKSGRIYGFDDVNVHEMREYDFYGNVLRTIPININVEQFNDYYIYDITRDGRYIALGIWSYVSSPNGTITRISPYLYDSQTQSMTRIITYPDSTSVIPQAISDDGRYILLLSGYNFSPLDTNTKGDLYLYDRQTAQIHFISNMPTEVITPYSAVRLPIMSSDGQHIVFGYSLYYDVEHLVILYHYNTQTKTLEAITTPSGGLITAINWYQSGKWYGLRFSDNNRYLTFSSNTNNIVPNDTPNSMDAFVYDFQTNQFTLVSMNSNGQQTNGSAYAEAISSDGRFVIFSTTADNMVPNDTPNTYDLFLRDLQTGQIRVLSVDVGGHLFQLTSYYYFNSAFFNNNQDVLLAVSSRYFIPVPLATIVPPSPTPYGVGATTNPITTFSWDWMFESNRYELQIATDEAFTNIIHTDNYVHAMSYEYTFPSTGIYYWRVRGVNQLGVGDWSVNSHFIGIGGNALLDEQQLFNAMQSHLTNGITFALFDVTPTGILTTLQFSDGAVVTGTIKLVVQNGLLRITVESISGGSVTQQTTMRDTLPALIMTVLDEVIPDGYLGIETISMTSSAVDLGVVLPNP